MQLKQGGDSGRKCRVFSAGFLEPNDEQIALSLGSRGPGHVWSLSGRLLAAVGTGRLLSCAECVGTWQGATPGTQVSLCLCRGRAGVTPTPQNLTLKLKSTSPCPRGTCIRRRRSSRTSPCMTWMWPTHDPRYRPLGSCWAAGRWSCERVQGPFVWAGGSWMSCQSCRFLGQTVLFCL